MTDHRDARLRDAVRKHYQQQQPSQQALQQWQTLVQDNAGDFHSPVSDSSNKNRSQPSEHNPSHQSIAIWACAAVLLFMVGLWQFNIRSGDAPAVEIAGLAQVSQIADEVAKNHIKMRPLEIQTRDFQDLRRYFTELDFSPIPSSRLQLDPGQMLGARYCSIQSVTAAQLRYVHTHNGQKSNLSLYETEYLPEVFGILPQLELGQSPLVMLRKGLWIQVWVEQQLLMVAVSDNPLPARPGQSASSTEEPNP